MAEKGFNLSDEYSARYVDHSPHEEECTSSSWEHNKSHIYGSIANCQATPTEINETGAMAKVKI